MSTLDVPKESIKAVTDGLLSFLDSSRTAFHAVDTVKKMLVSAGFLELKEENSWKLEKSSSYFFTRNGTSIVAFSIGGLYQPGNGFHIIGGHTDSPTLRLKPHSREKKNGWESVSVETYGGGLWNTWFDRDLSLGGRVIVRGRNDSLTTKLVMLETPLLRIPSLAIHLGGKNLDFNPETHLQPVLCTAVQDELCRSRGDEDDVHSPALMRTISDLLQVDKSSVIDFDLSLFDTQPAAVGGIYSEFVFARGLDNLVSCFGAVDSITASLSSLETCENIRVIALFDHEEIGSRSHCGASSEFLPDTLKRIGRVVCEDGDAAVDSYNMAVSRSFLLSSDLAHAIHPNYPEKHHKLHQIHVHKGPVIKINAKQRYATSKVAAALIKECAKLAEVEVPLQEFVVRNDSPCGSTIGPHLSAATGMRTLDIGIPQLSMHSIREMCGTVDVYYQSALYKSFFSNFSKVDNSEMRS